MPDRRLKPEDLPPDMNRPETTAMLMALLDMQVFRMQMVDLYRGAVGADFSIADLAVAHFIFVFRERGAREAQIVSALTAPRRSIRNSLARLRKWGLVSRDAQGLYFPGTAMGPIMRAVWPGYVRRLRRAVRAFEVYSRSSASVA